MDEKKRIKLLAGLSAMGVVFLLYQSKDSIIEFFGAEEEPVFQEQIMQPVQKPELPVSVNKESVVKETKTETKKDTASQYVEVKDVQKFVQDSVSIGEVSRVKNEASLYKAKAELFREQVMYETEKKKLEQLLNPVPEPETKAAEEQPSMKESEFLALLQAQQQEISALKNLQTVSQQTIQGETETAPKYTVPSVGTKLLSVQKLGTRGYTALMSIDGVKTTVRVGSEVNNDKVVSIDKNTIRMQSGKKYMF